MASGFLYRLLQISLCVITLLIIGLTFWFWKSSNGTTNKYCETQECISSALRLMKNMNKSVDACDDFYEFACGSFVKMTEVPEDKTVIDSYTLVEDEIDSRLRKILENENKYNNIGIFPILTKYYSDCKNESYAEEHSVPELISFIQSFGGWPVLKGPSWDDRFFDWKTISLQFLKAGFDSNLFVSVYFDSDYMNRSRNIITINDGHTKLPKVYLRKGFHNDKVQLYYKYMVNISNLLGAERSISERELKESVEFEISLANISLPLEEQRNITKLYNPVSVSELRKRYKHLDLVDYLNQRLVNFTKLDENEIVNLRHLEYFDKLANLLERTPKRVQANYALWSIVSYSVPYMSKLFKDMKFEYDKVLIGLKSPKPTWKKCFYGVRDAFEVAFSYLYIKQFFSIDDRQNVVDLLVNIRNSFEKILHEVDWMDTETKRAALEKLHKMKVSVGFPDEFLNDEYVEEYYENLNLSTNSVYKHDLTLLKLSMNQEYKKFRQPPEIDWSPYVYYVNAFYYSENHMIFPAGILQSLYFEKNRPQYLNYGGIGQIMGHEITHGFDDRGRRFDQDGHLSNWWQETANQKFLESMKCIIEFYGNYTVDEVGMKVNGISTEGENIADIGGVKEAYLAYITWQDNNEIEEVLPGFNNYTSRQMFWISFASTQCAVERSQSIEKNIVNDVHSPHKFRINGPVSNLPEFSKDFECPLGSKMNPVRKCVVW